MESNETKQQANKDGKYFISGNSLMRNHGEFASRHILVVDATPVDEKDSIELLKRLNMHDEFIAVMSRLIQIVDGIASSQMYEGQYIGKHELDMIAKGNELLKKAEQK